MSLQIYHGEDSAGAYQAMQDAIATEKKTGATLFNLEGKTLTSEEFFAQTAQDDFFAAKKIVVINNLLSRTKSKARDALLALLQDQDEIILTHHSKKLTAATEKLLPRVQKFYFPEKSLIWSFLPLVQPQNQSAAFANKFQAVLAQNDAQYLLAMLIWQFSQVLEAQAGVFSGAPFRLSSLTSQAQKFPGSTLTYFFATLLDLDYRSKSGGLRQPLDQEIYHLLYFGPKKP